LKPRGRAGVFARRAYGIETINRGCLGNSGEELGKGTCEPK
jgi:hypothetical protein